MALEQTFRGLSGELQKLYEELAALRVMLVEDKPLRDEVMLVASFGDAAENLLGLASETLAHADEAYRKLVPNYDLESGCAALAKGHVSFSQLMQHLMQDLSQYERVDELLRLGRRRRGEWEAWARGVQETLERCQPAVFQANSAFADCWREMAEQAIRNHVRVRANVGLS